jgi:hypothetical protein
MLNHDLYSSIIYQIRGFKDRRKAIDKAIAEIKKDDRRYRHIAENTVKSDYGLSRVKVPLNDKDTANFLNMVEKVVKRALK